MPVQYYSELVTLPAVYKEVMDGIWGLTPTPLRVVIIPQFAFHIFIFEVFKFWNFTSLEELLAKFLMKVTFLETEILHSLFTGATKSY